MLPPSLSQNITSVFETPCSSITGKSVHELLNPPDIRMRCICDISNNKEDIIQCTSCKLFLHTKCLHISTNIPNDSFICPFCQYQSTGKDPFSIISEEIDDVNQSLKSIFALIEKISEISNVMQLKKTEITANEKLVLVQQYQLLSAQLKNEIMIYEAYKERRINNLHFK